MNKPVSAQDDSARAPSVASPTTPVPTRSHTQEHPTVPPHTLTNRSTFASPEPFIRIFLLAWAVRYIPRGLFGELFEKHSFPFVKKPVDRFIDKTVLNSMEGKINKILTENKSLVEEAQSSTAKRGEIQQELFGKLKSFISHWRGDESEEIHHIVTRAQEKDGAYVLSNSSKSKMRNLVRGKMDDIAYSLSLFVGSTALSINYSQLVKRDLKNLFCETVALENNTTPDKVTFNDIVKSDNHIIQGTLKNYHKKLRERLTTDAAFLGVAPLKSMPMTDLVLGVKGYQMFRDTWRRKPTLFEDLVTFVNNKINPTNGLGQPISVGEVFDLYQHYAQAHTPERAFIGVIEHAKGEGMRWAGNQIIFQRMTELLNKTYAYKHTSIIDQSTGQTVPQGNFDLPKFMYLLGHDLIDIDNPQKTLVAIELANNIGIPAVKDMQAMLNQGLPVSDVITRYHVTLPTSPTRTQAPEPTNSVAAKATNTQLDHVENLPTSTIDPQSIRLDQSLTPTSTALRA